MPQRPIILHLSDLQFGRHNRFVNGERYIGDRTHLIMAERILDDLARIKKKSLCELPNVLIVTGDIAEQGQPDEFRQGAEFIQAIVSELHIPTDRVVVLPGNHDINWKLCAAARLRAEAEGKTFINSDTAKLEFFRQFYDSLFAGSRKYVDDEKYAIVPLPELGVVVVAFNSCVRETDKDHYGYIDLAAVREAAKRLEVLDFERKLLRICALHHNYFRQSDQDDENLRNADEIRHSLLSSGFTVLLHGHRHVGDMRIDSDPEGRGQLLVMSTGSAGLDSATLPDHPNQYQLVDFTSPGLIRCVLRRFSHQTLAESGPGQWLADSTTVNDSGLVTIPFPATAVADTSTTASNNISGPPIRFVTDHPEYEISTCPIKIWIEFTPPIMAIGVTPLKQASIHHLLVLDVSGSMKADNKYPYALLALQSYCSTVSTDDIITLITFSDSVSTLEVTAGPSELRSKSAVRNSQISGAKNFMGSATMLGAGLARATDLIQRSSTSNMHAITRVVVLTDGLAHDAEVISHEIESLSRLGADLFVIGLGDDFDATALGIPCKEHFPSAIRFVSNPEELKATFDHFARTSKRIIGTAGELKLRAKSGLLLKQAFSLAPHDFPLHNVNEAELNHVIGRIESKKRYAFLVHGSLLSGTNEADPILTVDVIWTDTSGNTNQSHQNISILRSRGAKFPADPMFEIWDSLVSRHAVATTDIELRSLRARLTLAEKEGQKSILKAIQKRIAILEGRAPREDWSPRDSLLLDAHQNTGTIGG